MNERFLLARSPLDAKYKRTLEGKTLSLGNSSEEANSSPRALLQREKIFKELLLEQRIDDFIAPILYPSTPKASTVKRSLQSTPIKVLDAPGLEDDFYQNLLDWDWQRNRLCVLLNGKEVYFWNAAGLRGQASSSTTGTTCLGRSRTVATTTTSKGCVVKVQGDRVAVGTKTGILEIWDQERGIQTHTFTGHPEMRCGVLSWQSTEELSSGGRDGRVVHYDLRLPRGITAESLGHTQEICGLSWNDSYCASGGNDNLLMIWDRRRLTQPMLKLSAHCAAVKALAWSPHQSGLLASGGGTADRTIRFWNVRRAVPLYSPSPVEGFGSESLMGAGEIPEQLIIQASSQVCTLAWSPLRSDEVLSTHGFSEHNLALWSYPGGKCVGRFEGHSQRVLFQATSPDGSTVATGSGDQTIRFWNVFRQGGRSKTSTAGAKKPSLDTIIFNSSR